MVVSWCKNVNNNIPLTFPYDDNLYSMLHEKKIEMTILIQQEG